MDQDVQEMLKYKIEELVRIVSDCGWQRSDLAFHLGSARKILVTSLRINKELNKQTRTKQTRQRLRGKLVYRRPW